MKILKALTGLVVAIVGLAIALVYYVAGWATYLLSLLFYWVGMFFSHRAWCNIASPLAWLSLQLAKAFKWMHLGLRSALVWHTESTKSMTFELFKGVQNEPRKA